MKLLCLSSDLRELAELLERLLGVGIRCAVHEYSNSQVGVWVQSDNDLPRALQIVVDRDMPRPLPPWASLLGTPLTGEPEETAAPTSRGQADPATETEGKNTPSVVVVRSEGSTRTGTRRFFKTTPALAAG